MPTPTRLEAAVRQQVRIELAVRKAMDEQGEKKESVFFRTLKHPLALLIIGSLLTAGVGSFFTAQWQFNQWRNEQEHQLEIERAKEMRQLQIETAEALADVYEAAVEVLHIWEHGFEESSKIASLEDRSTRWLRANRTWRRSHRAMIARVYSSFGLRIGNKFRELSEGPPKRLENAIGNLLSLTERRQKKPLSATQVKQFDEERSAARQLILEFRRSDEVQNLMGLMEAEIRKVERQRREAKPTVEFWPF